MGESAGQCGCSCSNGHRKVTTCHVPPLWSATRRQPVRVEAQTHPHRPAGQRCAGGRAPFPGCRFARRARPNPLSAHQRRPPDWSDWIRRHGICAREGWEAHRHPEQYECGHWSTGRRILRGTRRGAARAPIKAGRGTGIATLACYCMVHRVLHVFQEDEFEPLFRLFWNLLKVPAIPGR